MDPLVKDKADPVWQCWLAHVAVCRFSVRRSFVRGIDSERIDALNNKFLAAFEAVPQWQDAGYEKPKFHPAAHLGESLDEFGPFRAFWCMPWEAFLQVRALPTRTCAPSLSASCRTSSHWPTAPRRAFAQVLKRMFDMCNWRSAPHTVCIHWATKSVMHYRDPARGSWYTDAVKAESEEAGWAYDVEAIAHRSPGGLAAALVQLQETPQAVRSIVSVTRGRDEVCRGDWIVVRQVGVDPIAGEVKEMMQCIAPGSAFSFIRMWCTNCKPLREDELSGVMYALSAASAGRMLVRFECMQVEAVVRSVRSGREEFV